MANSPSRLGADGRSLRQPAPAVQVYGLWTDDLVQRAAARRPPTLQRMADWPMFSRMDADRILRRAAEIEGTEDAGPLTVAELRSIAGEAGFGSRAVERAIVEAQQADAAEVSRHPVQKSGLVITHLSTMRAVPIEISSDQLMSAVRLFQPYREGPAHIDLGEHQIMWRDLKGLRFAVTSAGGVTEIRVLVSKFLVRKGKWMGWVKSAADRLEALVYLVATRNLPSAQELGAHRLNSKSSAAGLDG
jgi:hypothetical protein